jgi:N-acetylneuraminic acid mutarotase
VQGTGSYSSAVTWGATNGAITSSGVFAPTVAGTVNVTATSTQDTTKSGTASIAVGSPVVINEWAWMGGSDTADAKGAYGTLGVASANNVPGARTGSVSWTDGSGNLWLFGGNGLDSVGTDWTLNDLWEFSPANNEWAWMGGSSIAGAKGVYGTLGVASTSNVPGAGGGAVSWTDKSGNFWLFGGNQFENALWEFNPTNKEWTWMGGSSTAGASGTYGTLGVPSIGNVPGGRWGAVSWTDGSGNFWLFGGEGFGASNSGGVLNDLWEFSPATENWTWVSGSSNANAVGVYGALGVPSTANVPGARSDAVGWVDGNGNLWLFGGSDNLFQSDLNDLWEFNPTAKTWTWVSGSNTHGVIAGVYGTEGVAAFSNEPGSRCLAVSWTDSSGNLWLFGGQGYGSTGAVNGDLNDLWKYSPATKEWTWAGGSSTGTQQGPSGVYGTLGVPAATNVPGGRDSAVSWTDRNGNLWLFGGESVESFNDLWRYDP